MKYSRIIGLLALACLTACHAAPKKDEDFGHWRVMQAKSDTGMLCYAGSNPVHSDGNAASHDVPYLMVTRRISGKLEVSASAGYNYPAGSKVRLVINDASYRLFFKGKTAWANNSHIDSTIIEALLHAASADVKVISDTDVTLADHYSLDGFVAAIAQVKALCP